MWIIQYESNLMVSRHAGTLPVLLTSPHGAPATAKPPGVSERKSSPPGCPPDKIVGDSSTRQITTEVAQLLLETFGEAPYVVIADYHRKFIDANRSEQCAFNPTEAAAARPFHAEYHQTIRKFIDEIQAENGCRGFLFDIHGTKTIEKDPADVYIGTDNGNSVRRLFTHESAGDIWQSQFARSPAGRRLHRFTGATGYSGDRAGGWRLHHADLRQLPRRRAGCDAARDCSIRSARVCLAGTLSSSILGGRSPLSVLDCFEFQSRLRNAPR